MKTYTEESLKLKTDKPSLGNKDNEIKKIVVANSKTDNDLLALL